eukprot:965013_1
MAAALDSGPATKIIFTQDTPYIKTDEEILELLNANSAAKTLFGQFVIKGALAQRYSEVFGPSDDVAHLALKKYWKFEVTIADELAEKFIVLAREKHSVDSAIYILLVADYDATRAIRDKDVLKTKLKNMYWAFMQPDVATTKSLWTLNVAPKLRRPIMEDSYGSGTASSPLQEGLNCGDTLEKGVLGEDDECRVALDTYEREAWLLLSDIVLVAFLDDAAIAKSLEEIRPDHFTDRWNIAQFKANQDLTGLYKTRAHAGFESSRSRTRPDLSKKAVYREYGDMYHHSSFGDSIRDQYDDYGKEFIALKPHQQFNDRNHFNPLISGEYNDASGSESSLFIGGVVGASSVIIIMLIFCLGLGFGMVIYWGYSQKKELDVKRKKEEMRDWIDKD